MIRFLADENFDRGIVDRLRSQLPDLDIVVAQDTEIKGKPDPTVLAWAAREGRVVLTHDVQTLTKYAYERTSAGLPMPGVVEVKRSIAIGDAISGLSLIIVASRDDEWEGQVRYILP